MFDEQPDDDLHGECAAEIHRLEAKLAEVTRERDDVLALSAKLQHQYDGLFELYASQTSVRIKKEQLDAALAREQQLRKALENLPKINISEQPEWEMSENNGSIWKFFLERYCSEALATPHDDSALKAYVAKEQAKMLREMALVAESETWSSGFAYHLRLKADELEGKK